MNRRDEAIEIFNCGFNCSQAVLSVFCDHLDFDKETALKISTGFGGGMRKGEVCGAVTGAIMVLGLKEGHFAVGETKAKSKAYELVKDFESRFEKLNESIICKNLLKYDLSVETELAMIKEKGLFDVICPKVIADAIDIIEEILILKDS
ncbi:MAG: C-GCAxxG-C-C family protein [Spirochaetaceae bacterium]|jgi:C_GCAxxG_C_C family probable redox protein|nr:C-GCAxxG-C-C family protein [Spirochaetaceae bacterium]